ncbi:MAG: DUF1223 domain-containing protein [Telluria sp.]
MPATRHFAALFGTALLATILPAPASYATAVCEVNSAPTTAALVELYTSEGCSSCPPADRQLAALRSQLPPGAAVVPVGLHVSYWDGLGWRDPFAQTLFDARQRALLDRRRLRVAYTPQFFVNGAELRDWQDALAGAVRRANSLPAAASITLAATPTTRTGLRLDVRARATDPRTNGDLYVAITEGGLETQVRRGENGGATLRHDDTARLWLGPIALVHGQAGLHRELVLPPDWRRERLRALAFVQDGDAHVLQAVDTAACKDGFADAGWRR